MVWSDEQINLWYRNYQNDFEQNKMASSIINTIAIILNAFLVLLLIIMPEAKTICPFIWGADVALFIKIIKYQRLIHYPIEILDKIIKQIKKCEPLTKGKTKEEILQDKEAMKILTKIVRLLNKYEKFMRKNYEKN